MPVAEHLELGAQCLSAGGDIVGGDWCDCLVVDNNRVALVVGDVMGKGKAAAAEMRRVRAAVRSAAAENPQPAAVLTAVEARSDDLPITGIVTVVYALVDCRHGTARIGRAGHLPPVLVRLDGAVELVTTGGSPPLGVGTAHVDGDVDVDLDAGSLMMLYTDGLVEDRRTGLDPGLQRLAAAAADPAARRLPAQALADHLVQACAPDPPDDDTALLVARYRPGGAARRRLR